MDLKLENADILIVDYTFFKHYAIYDKNRNSVIEIFGSPKSAYIYLRTQFLNLLKLHIADMQKSDSVTFIQSIPLEEFIQRNINKRVYIDHSNYTEYYKIEPNKVVENARTSIGQKGWNPATRNCEHFAMWAKTGKAVSLQVSLYNNVITFVTLAIMIFFTSIHFILILLLYFEIELKFNIGFNINIFHQFLKLNYEFNLYDYLNLHLLIMFWGTILIFISRYLTSMDGKNAIFDKNKFN